MNPTIAPPTLSTRTKVAGTLTLALLAYFGSVLNFPLFFGVSFIFGSIMAMLAIVFFGALPGLVVGMAGGLYTVVLFGHPYALIIFSLEALAVGLLYRRGVKNLVLADLAYWLLIGVPLVFLFYRGNLGMTMTPAALIAFKQPLNGVFNALVASLILLGLQIYWRDATRLGLPRPALPDILFQVLLTLILLAGTIPIVNQGHNHRHQEEKFLNEKMGDTVQRLAKTFETQGLADISLQKALLGEAHTISGLDLALLDANGQVLAKAGKLSSLDKSGAKEELGNELSIWLPSGKMPTMKRWKQGYYQYRLALSGTDTVLMAETSAAPMIGELENNQLYLFALLSALLLGGVLIARLASRWLTQPLSALENASNRLTSQIADGIHPNFPHSPIQEYDNLNLALRDMTVQLADNFHELHRIQDGLEEQIHARTSDLEQSESRLRRELDFNAALFSAAGALMLVLDRNGNIVRLNEAGERLTGYRFDEIANKPFWEFFLLPEEHDAVMSIFKNLQAGSITSRYENHWRMRDGTKRLFDWSNAVITDQDGRVEYIVTIGVDITDRHAAEHALKDEAQRTQAILDNAVDGIITIDERGTVSSMNKAAEHIFGYEPNEVIGQNIKMLMPEPYRGNHDNYLHNYITTGQAKIIGTGRQVTGQRKNGETFPMGLSVSEVSHQGQRMFIGLVRDITIQKQAEQALKDQVQRTQAILDNAVDGIITIDERGTVSTVNKSTEHIFGYVAGEIIGQNINMLMPEPYHSAHDGYLHNYVTTGKAKIIGIGREVTGLRKNGEQFPMDLSVSEISHQGKRMFVGLVRDITERKRAEQMKNEFVSTVSHELRTPLTSISGTLALIAGGALGELPEQASPMLDIALKNSKHLANLINDLLDMEKIAAGKLNFELKTQLLHPLLEQAMEANQAYGDQYGVAYALTGPTDDIQVMVDSQRLIQVLSNFLSNAAKFSPRGGSVEVAAKHSNGRVRVSVIDHGPGIPNEFRKRIFQKFTQADASDTRQKGGTGLGLAISKELIERMGGDIGFESEEGKGSTFYFELPIHV